MIRRRGSEPIAESMSASVATLSGALAAWTLGMIRYLQKYGFVVKSSLLLMRDVGLRQRFAQRATEQLPAILRQLKATLVNRRRLLCAVQSWMSKPLPPLF